MAVDSQVLRTWEHSRTVVRIWLYISVAVLIAGLFYAPAMVYTYTYNYGNPTAGTLVSQRWTFAFVVQALYPLLWLPLLLSGAEMLINWHHAGAKGYFYFHTIWCFVCIVWFLGSGIALGIEAGAANTADAPTNFFNDYRYCGVFWSYVGPSAVCRLTAGYTPPVLLSDLGINPEGIWMLVFHWLFFLLCCFELGNLLTYYRHAQPTAEDMEEATGGGEDEEQPPSQQKSGAGPRQAPYVMPPSQVPAYYTPLPPGTEGDAPPQSEKLNARMRARLLATPIGAPLAQGQGQSEFSKRSRLKKAMAASADKNGW